MAIVDLVRERGPLTVAAFMDLALYDSEIGYYARAARRSGRAGDFFTSVDVGPMFGELLAVQIAEMAAMLSRAEQAPPLHGGPPHPGRPVDSRVGADLGRPFHLVEAGAGNGRLAAGVL